MDLSATERVRLSVPAATPAVRIARAGAAGLATRAGFTYHEVEQIQLAVGEAAALLADPQGDGRLTVTFDITETSLVVVVDLTVPGASAPHGVTGGRAGVPAIAAAVLDAATDEWRVERGGRQVVLRKDLAAPDRDDD